MIELFGRPSPVELTFTDTPNEQRITAVQDRSQIIATHKDATRHFGVVGRTTSGKDTGRYIRGDGMAALDDPPAEHTESARVMIRVADDPDMQINCVGGIRGLRVLHLAGVPRPVALVMPTALAAHAPGDTT